MVEKKNVSSNRGMTPVKITIILSKIQQKLAELSYPITTQSQILTHQRYIPVEQIVRKGEIACNKQFLLFSRCFLFNIALTFHFKCTLKCLQFVSIWTSLKFCCLVMG